MVRALADAAAAAVGGVIPPREAVPVSREYYYAADLEVITGIPESTWYYYAFAGKGPRSHKIGRRRVWPVVEFRKWLAEQEAVES
jgi:prophage regulatory protein